MKYKMLAIDLDGTLLNEEKKLTVENINTLKKIHNKGVEIVIATGRRYWSAKSLTKDLNINLVIMANNGNIVRKVYNDEVLVTKYLNESDFYTLIKRGRERGMHPILHVDHYEQDYDIIIEFDVNNEKYSSYMAKNLDRYKKIDDFLSYKDSKVLAVCYLGDIKNLEEFESFIKNSYPKKYSSHIMSKLTIAGGLLEIMNPMGSKWLSLKEYAFEKGIKPKEIIAIGDDNNDIEMLKNAGLGISMKNASKKVKEVADIITEQTNNESGVSKVLNKVFKGK